ncbi:hypothetical protein [Herbidospora sp. NBRC 101105]|nr:hypothetical protein [Herbidospora sp. NBRC 101105]
MTASVNLSGTPGSHPTTTPTVLTSGDTGTTSWSTLASGSNW